MTISSQSPERVFSAICTNGVFRIRTRATIGPQNASLPTAKPRVRSNSRSSATFLPGRGNWDRTIERTNSLVALVRSLFLPVFRGDTRLGFLNFSWPFKASSSLSFGSFVKHRQEPASVQNVLLCENHLSLFAAAHGPNHEARSIGNGQKSVGEFRNVVR